MTTTDLITHDRLFLPLPFSLSPPSHPPSSLLSLFSQDYLQGDSTKAYQELGWKPKVTFEVRVTHPGLKSVTENVLPHKFRHDEMIGL